MTQVEFCYNSLMRIIADLQLHSKYSRAVSKYMDLKEIARWASIKGIDLVATGDWTHPLWFKEIVSSLVEVRPGIFKLNSAGEKVLFLLSTEISSIYSKGGKLRRVHNLLFSPSIECCRRFIFELEKRGANLAADGRPIVGIPSDELLEIALGIDENMLLIPAHIWTPWFALFGSKSGFNSIEECFGPRLSKFIYAVETGLSSDPAMNWQIPELYDRSIVSFSDAHSGQKIGREATVFVSSEKGVNNFNYMDIVSAIRQDSHGRFQIGYTIEFFPEEGKYHWNGHRNCKVVLSPQQTLKNGSLCPVCHRELTIGVADRVQSLSKRFLEHEDLLFEKDDFGVTYVFDKEKKRKPFTSIIPLVEILKDLTDSPTKSLREYERLTAHYAEFDILLQLSYKDISTLGGALLSSAIKNMRERTISISPGYDGLYGTIQVLDEHEKKNKQDISDQPQLF